MTHERNPAEDIHRCQSCGTSLREKALLIREEAVEERENDLRRREELFALQQGRLFALRVQEISDAQIAKVTLEYRHSQLKQVNKYLVVESQIRHDGNRNDQCRIDSLEQSDALAGK